MPEKKTRFFVEIDPFVLWRILPEEQRPRLSPERLELFEDLVYVSSGAEENIGGPSLSFDGTSVSLVAGGYRLLLAQRLRLRVWSPLTLMAQGTLEAFLDLCKGRIISREELSEVTSRIPDDVHTTLLYRFSRSLSEAETELFWQKISAAVEYGKKQGHTFGSLEFRDGHKVAVIDAHLKWEDRGFGAMLFQAVAEFDMEVCPVLGFKGTEFFNPLRAAT